MSRGKKNSKQKRKQKSGNQKPTVTETILLITAILELAQALIELIRKLSE